MLAEGIEHLVEHAKVDQAHSQQDGQGYSQRNTGRLSDDPLQSSTLKYHNDNLDDRDQKEGLKEHPKSVDGCVYVMAKTAGVDRLGRVPLADRSYDQRSRQDHEHHAYVKMIVLKTRKIMMMT